jgi:hypothetical protein
MRVPTPAEWVVSVLSSVSCAAGGGGMPRLTTLRTATIGGFRSLLYRAGPFLARRFNRDVIDNEGRAVRKARYQVQLASHGLNVAAKR